MEGEGVTNPIIADASIKKPTENRGIQIGAVDGPLPLPRVLELLRESGFPSDEDRLLRWRRDSLIGPTLPSGVGNSRLIAADDVRRVLFIAEWHKLHNVEKAPNSEIAFWLATAGYDVPSHLIATAVEDGVRRFTGLLLRLLGKGTVATWMLLDDPSEAQLQRVIRWVGKKTMKAPVEGLQPVARLFAEATASVLIGQIFKPGAEAKYGPKVAQMLRVLRIPEEHVTAWTPHIWAAVVDVAPFFVLGDGNALIQAARHNKSDESGMVQRAPARGIQLVEALAEVYTPYSEPWARRGLVPVVAGLLLHLKDNPGTEELLQRLDSGDKGELTAAIGVVKMVVAAIGAYLTGRAIQGQQTEGA